MDQDREVARKIVWVELADGKVIRIFRSQRSAFANCEDPQARYKDEAVGEIRRQVYDRAQGRCEHCGKPVPYDSGIWERMHMHEVKPKGSGGEVSLANCECLCPKCHLDGVHGNRKPRFEGNKKAT